MYFGLTNSPATFQAMMDEIFKAEKLLSWLKLYMDDILICGKQSQQEELIQRGQ